MATETKSVLDRLMFIVFVVVTVAFAGGALYLFYDANRLRVAYADPGALDTSDLAEYRADQDKLLEKPGWADDRALGGEAGQNKRSQELGFKRIAIRDAMVSVTRAVQSGQYRPTALTSAQRDKLDRLDMGSVTPEMIVASVDNPQHVSDGEGVFKANCAACHGAQGNGLVGPNLTDKYWIHGDSAAAVYKVIAKGVLAKGMPSWGHLGEDKMKNAAAYVLTLKGKNIPGKAPQGVDADGNPPGDG